MHGPPIGCSPTGIGSAFVSRDDAANATANRANFRVDSRTVDIGKEFIIHGFDSLCAVKQNTNPMHGSGST